MMFDPNGPKRPPIAVEPIAEPDLANGLARCLDEFVFQDQTQDKLYEVIRQLLVDYFEQKRACMRAQQQQFHPQEDMGDGGFAEFMEGLMRRRKEHDEG